MFAFAPGLVGLGGGTRWDDEVAARLRVSEEEIGGWVIAGSSGLIKSRVFNK